ncbi:MAG: MBL fold metallo-hydrolase [Rhodococcus sp. (in: high G+C Gram-positive bacteria)]
MILHQYYLECLSHASYLVGDEDSAQAVVIDPQRDVNGYLDDARAAGITIVGVINTHVHADFVAGNIELATETGAWIGFGERAEIDYPIRRLANGDRVRLGQLDIEVLETPGHTWESISIVVRETPDSAPYAVCTGDALFIGDVGRPDLASAADVDTESLARAQFHSLHKLLTLPDSTRVLPAHGAGSSCGKNLSSELSSTVGEQRRDNYAAQPMSETAFVSLLTVGQPPVPAYFAVDAELNRRSHKVFDQAAPLPELDPEHLSIAARTPGTYVIDTRDPDAFADRHIAGSINIGLDGRFAETTGMLVPHHAPVVILTVDGRGREAAIRLGRIGFDVVTGHHDLSYGFAPELAWLLCIAERVTPTDIQASRDDVTVVDIRSAGERENGAIPGSLHIPLPQLAARRSELPADTSLIVYCAGGWRSSVAASYLRRHGNRTVTELRGGFTAWSAQTSCVEQ